MHNSAESNVVDRQIRNLRARLQDDWREPRFGDTIPRRAYRFLLTFTCQRLEGTSFLTGITPV
jgi:DNA-binding winged helix-turn-helix (wHTH) protein